MPISGTELRRAALELKLAQAREELEAAATSSTLPEALTCISAAQRVLARSAAEDQAEYQRVAKLCH